MVNVTHVGFSDESNWNKGRLRSLGLVTAPVEHLAGLEEAAHKLLNESRVKELAWKDLDGAKERFAAKKLCKFAVERACERKLRVDVLIWDTEDSRHHVPKRDDIGNLQRMYYHLFENVLRLRWPDNAVWRLYPDINSAMNWETVRGCLEAVSTNLVRENSLFTEGLDELKLRKEFGIEEIQPVADSSSRPLLQLADLFAGMAVFSRENFSGYQRWLKDASPQSELFKESGEPQKLSGSAKERFQVINYFDNKCKERSLGVGLKSTNGLQTYKPQNPLNFWKYEPQSPKDKAPTRS